MYALHVIMPADIRHTHAASAYAVSRHYDVRVAAAFATLLLIYASLSLPAIFFADFIA